MPSTLLSGPAGANKSALARRLLREASEPTVAADFQSIVAALLLLERGPDGKYPIRPDFVLPLAEYTRQAVIRGALSQELDVIASNSDGSPARRQILLSTLGLGCLVRVACFRTIAAKRSSVGMDGLNERRNSLHCRISGRSRAKLAGADRGNVDGVRNAGSKSGRNVCVRFAPLAGW